MKILETNYKGYKFRSRLEARWAVFFDACGVKWEYEPECFDLGKGGYYLPNFLLHNVHLKCTEANSEGYDVFCEVKRKMTDEDVQKLTLFSGGYFCDENGNMDYNPYPILIVGTIPTGETLNEIKDSIIDAAVTGPQGGTSYYNFITIMYDEYFAYPGVDIKGNFVLFGDHYMYESGREVDEKATANAYRLARQARFEHYAGGNF